MEWNFKNGIPIYSQIIDAMTMRIASGSYQPGETYNEKDPDGFYGDDTLVAQWKSNGEPEKDNDNEKGKDSTNTGDDMNPGAYASAMLISTIMLAGYVVWLRRKKNA